VATSSGQAGRGFEAAVGEQQRDALGQRRGARFAGDDRQIGSVAFASANNSPLRIPAISSRQASSDEWRTLCTRIRRS
jgi:hypothetical protein